MAPEKSTPSNYGHKMCFGGWGRQSVADKINEQLYNKGDWIAQEKVNIFSQK
jgi:hypothetical protein